MPQHALGPRRPYTVRVPENVDVAAAAKLAGYSNVSRWLADLAVTNAGRPDLALGPDRSDDVTEGQQLELSA